MSADTILGLIFGSGGVGILGLVLKYRGDIANRKVGAESTAYSRLEAENARLFKRCEDEEAENELLREQNNQLKDQLAELRRGGAT